MLKYCFQGKLLYFDSQVPLNYFPANSTDSKSAFIQVRAWCCGAKGPLLVVNIVNPLHQHKNPFQWVIKFNGPSETEIFSPISSVIITYTLESLSSLTQIIHNLQVTIHLNKKKECKKTHKTWGPTLSWHHWTWELYIIQIKICAEYRDMLPRPRLVCQEPGLRPIGRSPGVPDKSSRGLGSMSRYSAQILICFIAYIFLIFFIPLWV